MTRNQITLDLILSAFALLIVISVVVIGGFVAYSIYRDEVATPIARQKVPEVKNEFRQIPALAGTTATTTDGFTFDPQHLTEGRLYRTNLSYSKSERITILSFQSWVGKLDRESDVNGIDGNSHGGKQVLYSKGEFRARLYHKGTETQYGYDYYFCVTWDY